jgi:acetyl esterase/lipase
MMIRDQRRGFPPILTIGETVQSRRSTFVNPGAFMRHSLPILFLSLLCSTLATAAPTTQERPRSRLPEGVKSERDIQYVPDGDAAQRLDLYLSGQEDERPLPVLVWIHGGGWAAGSKADCPAVYMVPRRYVVASVEYRFSQKAVFPAQIQDCQAAIRWIRANSKKYNIDPDHIGVWGASAGGHLVALLGTAGGKNAFPKIGGNDEQSDRVQAVCDWFGPADFNTVMSQAAADKTKNIFKFNTPGDPYSNLIGAKLGEDQEKCQAVSPVHYVSKDNPPFLIMHGTTDALVPFAQSVELADALKNAKVDVILQPFPGSGHGGPAFGLPAVHDLITRFMDKYLIPPIQPLPDSAVTFSAIPAK